MSTIIESNKNGYNGWTNWETWLINLHMSENDYEDIKHLSREQIPYDLGQEIKNIIIDNCDDITGDLPALLSDMISGCLSEVNWQELAKYHTKNHVYENQAV